MNKWLSIQALRGVAVLGVVAYHSLTFEQKYSTGDLVLPSFFRLGQSGVDLFFVISGFVMVMVTRGRFGRNGETLRFLWGRSTRIYPTYWFYFFLAASVFLIKPEWVNAAQGHRVDLVASFLLLPSNQLPVVMVAWSLIHELWFYVVFSLMLQLDERLLLPLLLLWGAIITSANFFVTFVDLSAAARIVLHPYSLEFIIGALAAIFFFSRIGRIVSAFWALSIIILLVSVGIPLLYMFDVLENAGLLRAVFVGSLYGALLVSVMALEKGSRVSVPKTMRFLGDISYSVYLSHVFVLSAIGRMWMLAGPMPGSVFDNFFVCLVMLAAVVGSGWLGYRFIEQPAIRISHRLRTRWFESSGRYAPVVIKIQ
jgi:exopolysaccharide production protein ExoZ